MNESLAQLEINLRHELVRQRDLAAAIQEKVAAIRAGDVARIEKAIESLAALGIQGATLERQRLSLLEGMRSDFEGQVPTSLSQVLSRFAQEYPGLSALHVELREAARIAEDLCRKSSHLVRHFRDVYTMALDKIFEAAGIRDQESPDGHVSSGIVVNAEG